MAMQLGWLKRLLVVLAAALAPWNTGFAGMKKQPAEKFFSGPALTLAQAIQAGEVEEASALIPGVDLNRPGAEDMTLLFFALHEALGEKPRQLQIMTLLVKAGADPQQEVKDFGSVLGVALAAPSPLYAKALLDGGVSPNAIRGSSPILFDTASERTFDTLKLLLDRGAGINSRNTLGNTVLMEALFAMALDQVDYLLDRGASPDVVNINGVSFANQLQFQIDRQQEGSLAQRKMLEIRDRIVGMGVAWPPPTRDQERERMRARGQEPGKLLSLQ